MQTQIKVEVQAKMQIDRSIVIERWTEIAVSPDRHTDTSDGNSVGTDAVTGTGK